MMQIGNHFNTALSSCAEKEYDLDGKCRTYFVNLSTG
jgi:hypothetical protein